ncbi:MAG TPA: ATP-grasp domain-containing protein [Enhygromyxa sp.]|nr:ATP-grasp domain-containing protein [Enhygromyxa sp.]
MAAEQQSATDLREAARSLGIHCEVVAVPAHSARADFELAAVTELLRRRCAGIDRVLIVAHGHLGGSGRLHAAARGCGLSVLGPSELAIALAYDKLGARRRLDHFNVPVPRTVALDADPTGAQLERLGWPCVLKPRRGSGGAGVRRLDSVGQVRSALAQACRVDAELLLEREVLGRELSVVLLHGEVLGVAELDRSIEEHGPRTTSMVCPPNLSPTQRAGVINLARRAAAALQLSDGPTRVDLLVSERDNEVVLEVEPLPPLHRDGIVARVARAAGLSYPRLCAEIFSGAVNTRRARPLDSQLAASASP